MPFLICDSSSLIGPQSMRGDEDMAKFGLAWSCSLSLRVWSNSCSHAGSIKVEDFARSRL